MAKTVRTHASTTLATTAIRIVVRMRWQCGGLWTQLRAEACLELIELERKAHTGRRRGRVLWEKGHKVAGRTQDQLGDKAALGEGGRT